MPRFAFQTLSLLLLPLPLTLVLFLFLGLYPSLRLQFSESERVVHQGLVGCLLLLFDGSERILLDLRRSVLRGDGVLCGNEVVASGAELSYL